MTKEEMVAKISKHSGIRQLYVSTVIEYLTEYITDELAAGNKVQFMGFGTFEPKERAARMGRNPHANQPVPIPAKIVPSFKAGNKLKAAVEKTLTEGD